MEYKDVKSNALRVTVIETQRRESVEKESVHRETSKAYTAMFYAQVDVFVGDGLYGKIFCAHSGFFGGCHHQVQRYDSF